MPQLKTNTAKNAVDIDGNDIMSATLLELINSSPVFCNKKVQFAILQEKAGIGLFPTSGAVILESKESITGKVTQICAYPCTIVYRAAISKEQQKIKVKETLDLLGKWLEQQPITINNQTYKLKNYPCVTSNGCSRVIKSISRTNAAHLDAAYQDGIEDWALSLTLKYENKYFK